MFRPGLAQGGFGFLKSWARPKPSLRAWPWPGPGHGLHIEKNYFYDWNGQLRYSDSDQSIISWSSSSSINRSSQENSSMSDSSGFPKSPPKISSKSSLSSSDLDDRPGSQKSKSHQILHLMHCRASTMSPLRWLQSFDIVIPPCENACSLETDNNITAR